MNQQARLLMQAYHPGIVELTAEAVTIEGGGEAQGSAPQSSIVVHHWPDDDSSDDEDG